MGRRGSSKNAYRRAGWWAAGTQRLLVDTEPAEQRDEKPAGAGPVEGDPAEQLRYGYTLRDLHRMARLSVHTDRAHSNRDYLERIDVAYGGIVEALYAAAEQPFRNELVERGRAALRDDKQAEMSFRGVSHHTMEPMPHYWRYWWFLTRPTSSPETLVVDGMALRQVWPTLRPDEQQALLTLAAHEDYQRAADALGLRYNTFAARIYRGRLRFMRALLGGETPRTWGHDRRAGRKGERATTGMTAARRFHRRHQMRAAAKEARDARVA